MFKLFRGVIRELTNQPHPDDHKGAPQVIAERRDRHGRVVAQRVRASSGSESTRHLAGTTIQGDRTVVSTHRTDIRRGVYDVHIEDHNTKGVEQKFTDPRHAGEDAAYISIESQIYHEG